MAYGTFLFLQQSYINRSVMGPPQHQTTLKLGFRQSALESSPLAISTDVDGAEGTAGSGREAGNTVVFHHSSVPSNLSLVCCLLSQVTFWLEQSV